MIKMNIIELLKKKNRSKYWLIKKIDSNYPQMNRLISGEAVGINFDTIEKLCRALECGPSDLLVIMDDPEPAQDK